MRLFAGFEGGRANTASRIHYNLTSQLVLIGEFRVFERSDVKIVSIKLLRARKSDDILNTCVGCEKRKRKVCVERCRVSCYQSRAARARQSRRSPAEYTRDARSLTDIG